MPGRDFTPFSTALNPFRTLDRQIDRMFGDSVGASVGGIGAAGAAGASADAQPEDQGKSPSLFMRVVGITSRMKKG